MISSSVIKTATAAFARLDTSAEDTKIAEIQQQIAEKQSTIDRANQRVTELHEKIRNYSGPSGRDIANALMQASTASTAALASPDLEALKTERANLQAGITELNHDIADLTASIQGHVGAAHLRATEAARPLLEHLMERGRDLARQQLAIMAAVKAISTAVSRHRLQEEEALQKALEGLAGQWCLLPYQRSYPVPAEIVEALRSLDLTGPALRGRVIEEFRLG